MKQPSKTYKSNTFDKYERIKIIYQYEVNPSIQIPKFLLYGLLEKVKYVNI